MICETCCKWGQMRTQTRIRHANIANTETQTGKGLAGHQGTQRKTRSESERKIRSRADTNAERKVVGGW